ncbi:MAG: hypothetical protein ACK6AD_13645 [Cyanobacteriota bacterium]|jgi:hypothetical protein
MSFDARSKERLESLGRTLPKKLPLPDPSPAPRVTDPQSGASGARPRGTRSPGQGPREPGVPSPGSQGNRAQGRQNNRLPGEVARHRLEREQDPAELFRALITASPDGSVPPHLLDRLRDLETSRQSTAAPPLPNPGKGSKAAASANRAAGRNAFKSRVNDEEDLYTAFAQLLLEDNND